jgi:hypothetical protein
LRSVACIMTAVSPRTRLRWHVARAEETFDRIEETVSQLLVAVRSARQRTAVYLEFGVHHDGSPNALAHELLTALEGQLSDSGVVVEECAVEDVRHDPPPPRSYSTITLRFVASRAAEDLADETSAGLRRRLRASRPDVDIDRWSVETETVPTS